jgi:hypothetical protein
MKARVTRWLGYLAFTAAVSSVVILGHLATHYYRVQPLTFAWFVVGLAVGIIFHEAGHAACCLIARIPIRRVVIGSGPVVLGGRIGGAQLELRLVPLNGAVHFDSPFPCRKPAIALVTIGGVLGNVAFLAAVAALAAIDAVPHQARTPIAAMVAAQFLLAAMSLLPFRARIGEARMATDGLALLSLMLWPLIGKRQMLRSHAEHVARYRGQLSEQWHPSEASQRIAFQLCRDGWFHDDIRREIQRALIAELEARQLPREEEMLVLDQLLTYALVCDDIELRAKLDVWSRRVLELGPEVKTLVATRGGVMIELGHYEAGKSLLLPLLDAQAATADALFDRLLTQYFLARAELALGNAVAAQALAVDARKTAKMIERVPAVRVLMKRLDTELKLAP